MEKTPKKSSAQKEEKLYSYQEFLESIPPNTWALIESFAMDNPLTSRAGLVLDTTDIRLFCSGEECNGNRFFSIGRSYIEIEPGRPKYFHTVYTCRNCQNTRKIYSVWIVPAADLGSAKIMKFGESPEYGPPTPSRVIKLIGPDRDLFIKGRRSENQGLGIGSFGYYRRVVENQKDRILDEIIKVSEKLGAKPEIIADFVAAKKEVQFSKAVESIKHGIPDALLLNGQNPITLLHNALSEGLHAQTDEDCLELAMSIRIVLTELADRLGQALKDEAELATAVSRLLTVKAQKKTK
jgi:hypothetical protein